MTYSIALRASAAALAVAAAAPAAFADVTADQVWSDWKATIESSGMTVTTGSEAASGGTLTISDLAFKLDKSDAKASGSIAQVVFAEQGDGTVKITMSDTTSLTSSSTMDGSSSEVALTIRQPGLALVASGSPGDMTYAMSGPEFGVTLDSMTVDGEKVPVNGDVAITGLEGTYHTVGTDPREITSDFKAANLAVKASGTPPEPDQGPFNLAMTFADVSVASNGTISPAMFQPNMTGIPEGFRSEVRMAHGAMSYTVDSVTPDGPMKITGSADTGTFDVGVSGEEMRYGATNTGTKIAVEVAAMPLPDLSLAIAESAFDFAMPLGKTEAPADFGLLLKLADLSVSDTIWNLADPGQVLPRDPATLILDIAGKAKWLIDITDPAAQNGADVPGELNALDLRELKLAVAGADLTGNGSFTFDNADLTTFDGMPAPTGSVDLMLKGGNGLIDKLVQMGILPEDQAMGARMMLGMFARPTSDPDTLTSRIEVSGDGQVIANGQRIK